MGMYLRDSARAFELWVNGAGPMPLEAPVCLGVVIGLFLVWAWSSEGFYD
jgi:hypothetical protein